VSGDETTHQKILAFLSGELSKKEERQCISIDLEHSPPGFRADLLKRWERTDNPEYFEELVFIEQMVAMMVEIAESDADSAGAGSGARAYTVRTRQQTGLRMTLKFRCAPSFESSDQALVVAGGNQPNPDSHSMQAMQIVSGNNRDLMRILMSQYRDTFGTLADLSAEMRDENVKLRAENIVLRRELEVATSTKEDKDPLREDPAVELDDEQAAQHRHGDRGAGDGRSEGGRRCGGPDHAAARRVHEEPHEGSGHEGLRPHASRSAGDAVLAHADGRAGREQEGREEDGS